MLNSKTLLFSKLSGFCTVVMLNSMLLAYFLCILFGKSEKTLLYYIPLIWILNREEEKFLIIDKTINKNSAALIAVTDLPASVGSVKGLDSPIV